MRPTIAHLQLSTHSFTSQSYGPLFPFAQYTILNSLLTSVACYIALGIVIITLIFPETINHAALVSTSDLLGKLQGLVDIQQQVMEATPADLAVGAPLANKLQGARAAILAHIQQCKFADMVSHGSIFIYPSNRIHEIHWC